MNSGLSFSNLLTVYVPDGIIIAIIVLSAIVLIAAGVIVYIALRKIKAKKVKKEAQAEEEPAPVEEEKPFVRREYTSGADVYSYEKPRESAQSGYMSAHTDEAAATYGDDEEPAVYISKNGGKVYVVYDYSFKARLIQSPEDTQKRYHNIKECLLSYGLKRKESWKAERYYYKGKTYAKLAFRGRTLCVNFAISPAEPDKKYRVEDVSDVKKYADVPCLYRIKNERRGVYAVQIADTMMTESGFIKTETNAEFVALPYATREQLIEEDLVRLKATGESGEEILPADFAAMQKHTFITVGGVRVEKVERISAAEAAASSDEIAAAVVDSDEYSVGKNKCIVNIDKISENYKNGETVTVDNLRAKGLIPKKANYVKVLARGTLDKALTVKAQEYSADAVKMIVLVGGTAIRIKVKK